MSLGLRVHSLKLGEAFLGPPYECSFPLVLSLGAVLPPGLLHCPDSGERITNGI